MFFLINNTQILKEMNKRKINKKENIYKGLLYLSVGKQFQKFLSLNYKFKET